MKITSDNSREQTPIALPSELACGREIATQELAGFRLRELEVYNWGTFHQKIWSLESDGLTMLLTGENGSGKSTLIDAFLTLLVPNKKRSYNMSSGSDRRERSEQSYVKGAYQRERSRYDQLSIKFLRDEKSLTALMAHFENPLTKARIAIGQIFWFESDELRKCLVSSHCDVKVLHLIEGISSPKELRRKLRELPETLIHDSFSEYQNYFLNYVGLRSVKGLDLFNQISTIKQIGRLNEFVRENMLDEHDISSHLDEFFKNFQDLTLSYQAILKAKDQIHLLSNIESDGRSLFSLQKELASIDDQISYSHGFFAYKLSQHLKKTIDDYSRKNLLLTNQIDLLQSQYNAVDEKRRQLQRSVDGLSNAMELSQLDLKISQAKELLAMQTERKKALDDIRTHLLLKFPLDSVTFYEEIKSCQELLEQKVAEKETEFNRYIKAKSEEQELSDKLAELASELQGLSKSKSSLPKRFLDKKEDLEDELGIPKLKLSFGAELMTVKPEEKAWRPAIERLLRPIALRLFIPDELFLDVNQAIRKMNLGLKLVLQRASIIKPKIWDDLHTDSMLAKLQFHPNSKHVGFLRHLLKEGFDYICVDNMRSFKSYDRAITIEGLIKRSQTLSEKDDRFSLHDSTQFILGWDNECRANALDLQLRDLRKRQKELSQIVEAAQRAGLQIDQTIRLLYKRLEYVNYKEVDVVPFADALALLTEQKEGLASNPSHADALKELAETITELKLIQSEKDNVLSEKAIAVGLSAKASEEQKILNAQVANFSENPELTKHLEKRMHTMKLKPNYESLSVMQSQVQHLIHQLQTEKRKQDQNLREQSLGIVKKLLQFKNKFPEYCTEFDPSVEGLPQFLLYYQSLIKDELPQHEDRFKKLLTKNIVTDVTAFKAFLEIGYESILQDIEHLNTSLKRIAYSDETYVQLRLQRTNDSRVREFQARLKSALKATHQADGVDLEAAFEHVRQLLNKMMTDDKWRDLVCDVRNWADFYVVELSRKDHSEVNFYSDSAGLSGGQKAKLAFTILGSALSYQYGLHTDKTREKSFRFVMIDEAFSKSDDRNSRYALELFKDLGLQLMVVTPADKMNVVRPYVSRVFITQMPSGEQTSKLITLKLNNQNTPVANSVH